jgi:hypothetical protein
MTEHSISERAAGTLGRLAVVNEVQIPVLTRFVLAQVSGFNFR